MYDKYQPTPFPVDKSAKKIFATASSVGIVSTEGKLYFVNDKIIDDSDCINVRDRVYESEDSNLNGDVLAIGGNYGLRYALVS